MQNHISITSRNVVSPKGEKLHIAAIRIFEGGRNGRILLSVDVETTSAGREVFGQAVAIAPSGGWLYVDLTTECSLQMAAAAICGQAQDVTAFL